MFPGEDRLILYFADSKKRAAAPCVAHRALIAELRELLGEENVVVKGPESSGAGAAEGVRSPPAIDRRRRQRV